MINMFEISSPQDLIEYKRLLEVQGFYSNACLTRNIDMTGVKWSPIRMFSTNTVSDSVLDGNGYAIRGLYSCPEVDTNNDISIVNPYPTADAISVKSVGLLFNASKSMIIRNLTLQGTLDLKKATQCRYSSFLGGGLTGSVYAFGAVENCCVEVNIKNISKELMITNGGIGGIAGVSEGNIQDCVYNGEIDSPRAAGIAFYNSGFIKNSYTENKALPIIRNTSFRFNTGRLQYLKSYDGLIDNIGLYMPGEAYYTGSMEDFFESDALCSLIDGDVFIQKPIKDSYWANVVLKEIADVIAAMNEIGAVFGKGLEGAPALSVLPFRNCSSVMGVGVAGYKRYMSRYSTMLEYLVKESPAFRRSLLEEMSKDPDKGMVLMSKYGTSIKRIKTILRCAEKYETYHRSIEADSNYIEAVYER